MASPSKSVVVNDFFSTIEEAGISDIAAEVGIIPRSGPASTVFFFAKLRPLKPPPLPNPMSSLQNGLDGAVSVSSPGCP